jgi:MinD superfamily P-loop ATPase
VLDNTIGVIGARGGQGTSTIAAAVALLVSLDRPVGLIANDPSDVAAILGISAAVGDDAVDVSNELTVARRPLPGRVNIVDCGSLHHCTTARPAKLVVVLRGPCFLALTSLVTAQLPADCSVVVVREAHRSITAVDVLEATGLPLLAEVPVTERLARIVDAGLLRQRAHALAELASLHAFVAELSGGTPDRRAS